MVIFYITEAVIYFKVISHSQLAAKHEKESAQHAGSRYNHKH